MGKCVTVVNFPTRVSELEITSYENNSSVNENPTALLFFLGGVFRPRAVRKVVDVIRRRGHDGAIFLCVLDANAKKESEDEIVRDEVFFHCVCKIQT